MSATAATPDFQPLPAAPEPEVMTVTQAAKFLQISENKLYEVINRLEIPHRRIGRAIRLSRTALIEWLASCGAAQKGS